MVLAYDTYVFERDRCRQARDCDFVLVNLFHPPLGAPMRPGAVNELLTGLSRRAGLSRCGASASAATRIRLQRDGRWRRRGRGSGAARPRPGGLDADLPASVPATVARGGRTRRCVGAGERRRPVSAVLAAVGDSRPQRTNEDPWSRLDAEFLTTAGWNPETETLAPQPDHPLLGFRCCRVQGCRAEAGPGGRVLRDLPEGLPTLRDVGRGVRRPRGRCASFGGVRSSARLVTVPARVGTTASRCARFTIIIGNAWTCRLSSL